MYKIWDKKEPINGVECGKVIESLNISNEDEIFLVYEGSNVSEIQFVESIRNLYKLDNSLSAIEVAEAYVEIIKSENEKNMQEASVISDLETKNKKLEEKQTQQGEEILSNVLAIVEIFEMISSTTPALMNIAETENNSIIKMYCTLIMKGIKNINDVPMVLKDQVTKRLKADI